MADTIWDIYLVLSSPYALLTLAFALDFCIGDPEWLPHPVRIMGRTIKGTEKFLRDRLRVVEVKQQMPGSRETGTGEKKAGILLALIITGSTYALFYIVNSLLPLAHSQPVVSGLSFLVMVYLISTTLAARELIDSSWRVIEAFRARNIEDAKKNLRHIVGRDTDSLDDKGMLRATIESLAENASDGIIAPLFYFAVGGLPLAMTYKAINTLDSMVGYKDEKYRHFGWASARLDDIVNYIPARITGLLIVASTFILSAFYSSLITHNSLKIMLRDGRRHSSPNSGIPEAAMAGALGVELGGPSRYGGIIIEKPFIGEDLTGLKNKGGDASLLNASEKAVAIIKVTSLLGLGSSLIFQYLRIFI